ncbi:MAG: acyl carrier protein [Symploca sp. SIO3C6]|uniref:Acyl carrier protein n=1 Tax=Symploca sp. SIO1C4 TaxID=2607765 RepID=A0A6B3NCE8_9CYAN|nr:acyl carrier protein [Symploca sp. SIO3C6]NER29337.1 acyl carrier protein [Symploca sp. SIO1C4]NET08280.1 acyl carrier protein [Symploca sp. SIO2B6]
MTVDQIKQKTQAVVLEMLPGVSSEELSDDRDIFSLGLDSVNAMNLIFGLQDAFEIQFATSEISFENFRTVSGIVELIKRKQEELQW